MVKTANHKTSLLDTVLPCPHRGLCSSGHDTPCLDSHSFMYLRQLKQKTHSCDKKKTPSFFIYVPKYQQTKTLLYKDTSSVENSINTDNKQVNLSAVRSAHMVPSGDVCSASVIHLSATEAFTVQDRVDTVEKKDVTSAPTSP